MWKTHNSTALVSETEQTQAAMYTITGYSPWEDHTGHLPGSLPSRSQEDEAGSAVWPCWGGAVTNASWAGQPT